jgi:hypothetical protein
MAHYSGGIYWVDADRLVTLIAQVSAAAGIAVDTPAKRVRWSRSGMV